MIDSDAKRNAGAIGSYMLGVSSPRGVDGGFVAVNVCGTEQATFGVMSDGPMTYFEFGFQVDEIAGKLFIRSSDPAAAFMDGAAWIGEGVRDGQRFQLQYTGRSHQAQRVDLIESIPFEMLGTVGRQLYEQR